MHMHTHVYIHVYTCMHIHTCIHIHAYTHTNFAYKQYVRKVRHQNELSQLCLVVHGSNPSTRRAETGRSL